jgi:hypothetical protein
VTCDRKGAQPSSSTFAEGYGGRGRTMSGRRERGRDAECGGRNAEGGLLNRRGPERLAEKTRNRVTLGHFKILHLGSPKNPQKRQPLTLMLHLGAFLPSGGRPRGGSRPSALNSFSGSLAANISPLRFSAMAHFVHAYVHTCDARTIDFIGLYTLASHLHTCKPPPAGGTS